MKRYVSELQESECVACGANIRYLVDASVMKLLEKKKSLPLSL